MDKFVVTILKNGDIRTVVEGSVSAPNHSAAEALLKSIAELAGGEVTTERLPGSHHHHHHDGHAHEHAGGGGHHHD